MGKKSLPVYNLNLKKFRLSKIKSDAVVVYIGRRRTGKSVALRDVLYHNRDVPYGIVISGSEEASPYFENFVPKTFIFNNFKEEIIDNLLERQKRKQKELVNTGKKEDNRLFLVLDDCLYDTSWMKTTGIRNLFMNGRHYKVFFHITMQYPLGIGPSLRTNIDYTFIMREPYISNRKRIYENFAGMFPDFATFCKVMDNLDKHECLVIDNNADSSKLEDQVFWFKAEMRDEFKMGTEKFWQYDKNNYSNEFDQKKEAPSISTYKGRQRMNLTINKLS